VAGTLTQGVLVSVSVSAVAYTRILVSVCALIVRSLVDTDFVAHEQVSHTIIIIIITNEKVKVMLSRKRCRGTLQDYKKREISQCQSKLWMNRNVFSWCLNGTREKTVRRDDGRLFHARGAATGKARSPR